MTEPGLILVPTDALARRARERASDVHRVTGAIWETVGPAILWFTLPMVWTVAALSVGLAYFDLVPLGRPAWWVFVILAVTAPVCVALWWPHHARWLAAIKESKRFVAECNAITAELKRRRRKAERPQP